MTSPISATRARSSCSTCCSGCCGISMAKITSPMSATSPTSTTRSTTRAARDFPGLPLNEAIRKVTELTEKQFHDDVDALGSLRPTVEPRATEHIARDARDHREAGAGRLCLCRRGSRAVLAAGDECGEFGVAALWRAGQPLARRDDRGRPRRCRALQARHHRLRAVEAGQARRAVMAVAGGHRSAGPSGLAHRMLGDGVEASRRAVRHPWRRHRSGVSAP